MYRSYHSAIIALTALFVINVNTSIWASDCTPLPDAHTVTATLLRHTINRLCERCHNKLLFADDPLAHLLMCQKALEDKKCTDQVRKLMLKNNRDIIEEMFKTEATATMRSYTKAAKEILIQWLSAHGPDALDTLAHISHAEAIDADSVSADGTDTAELLVGPHQNAYPREIELNGTGQLLYWGAPGKGFPCSIL